MMHYAGFKHVFDQIRHKCKGISPTAQFYVHLKCTDQWILLVPYMPHEQRVLNTAERENKLRPFITFRYREAKLLFTGFILASLNTINFCCCTATAVQEWQQCVSLTTKWVTRKSIWRSTKMHGAWNTTQLSSFLLGISHNPGAWQRATQILFWWTGLISCLGGQAKRACGRTGPVTLLQGQRRGEEQGLCG